MSYERKNDIQIDVLAEQFKNFIERYERDIKNQNIELASISIKIDAHDEFIRDLKPLYAKGMMALGAVVLGSIGMATRWLWTHVKWG